MGVAVNTLLLELTQLACKHLQFRALSLELYVVELHVPPNTLQALCMPQNALTIMGPPMGL